MYCVIVFTVSVNCVEHGNNPLLEGGWKLIVLLPMADILQGALELLYGNGPILKREKQIESRINNQNRYP